MARVASAVCERCGNSFMINLDECTVLGSMPSPSKNNKREVRNLNTWADWVDYIQHVCPDCRLPYPPPKVIKDISKYTNN
jgi:hypothetical protein